MQLSGGTVSCIRLIHWTLNIKIKLFPKYRKFVTSSVPADREEQFWGVVRQESQLIRTDERAAGEQPNLEGREIRETQQYCENYSSPFLQNIRNGISGPQW